MTYSERSAVGYRTKVQRTYKPDVPGFHGQRNIVKPISSLEEGKGSKDGKALPYRPCLPMRMCKWNKFRANNSTTISLQSADIGAKGSFDRRGPWDPNDDPPPPPPLSGISAGLMDSAPFYRRVVPQIYSVLLPFWYINFYSIWFAAIAMVIGRKRGARHDFVLPRNLSPRSPFSSSLSSHRRFPRPTSIFFLRFHDRRLLEKDISRFSLALNAPLWQPSWVPEGERYFLRIKIFEIYEVFSSARLREWFFSRSSWLWCFYYEEECFN